MRAAAASSRLTAGSAALALVLAFTGAWEGTRYVAYLDTGGVPTICRGSTRGVKLGDRATPAECDAMFTRDLIEHETGMLSCMKRPQDLSDKTYVAFLDLTYNIGVGAACKSTWMRKLNAGDVRGACEEHPRWVKDGGRIIRGLVNRRVSSRALCHEGLQ